MKKRKKTNILITPIFENITDIIKYYGNNLEELNFSNVNFENTDLSMVCLPKDKNLFQDIALKTIKNAVMFNDDYRFYNMKDVHFINCVFPQDSKLPRCLDFLVSNQWNDTWYNSWPIDLIKHAHLYKMSNEIYLDLKKSSSYDELSVYQKLIIANKGLKFNN